MTTPMQTIITNKKIRGVLRIKFPPTTRLGEALDYCSAELRIARRRLANDLGVTAAGQHIVFKLSALNPTSIDYSWQLEEVL